MGMTEDDYAMDAALAALHEEAMLERASREQAILVLVEGDSEEVALPILFMDASDAGKLVGVKIANYNGNGSMVAFMRLLIKTVQHPYPIVLTYDNDPDSVAAFKRCQAQGLITNMVFPFTIPAAPVVEYRNHKGGSFEEAFPLELFLEKVFVEPLMPAALIAKRALFDQGFNRSRPWLDQLKKFAVMNGYQDWELDKPAVAVRLAEDADPIPHTFVQLIDLISEVRAKHPVKHPTDVDLPKVRGLTY